MNFGEAIEALKQGKRVQRQGWNGKGMHLELWTPGQDHLPATSNFRKFDPLIAMLTAQGTMQPGWLASQADMLAEDWQTVP